MSTPVVFWDFDGTLARRSGTWSACLLECLIETGGQRLDIGRDDIRRFLRGGLPWHQHDRGHEHLTDADGWWAELEVVFVRALRGLGVASVQAQQASRLFRHRFISDEKWAVFPQAQAALQTVADAGWRNAILSNHVPELDRIVNQLNLGEHVHAIFTSAVVGWEKPNPKIFQHAAQAMGQPARMWMVGDNPVADIQGAEAVGIPAFLVHTESATGMTVGLQQAAAKVLADLG